MPLSVCSFCGKDVESNPDKLVIASSGEAAICGRCIVGLAEHAGEGRIVTEELNGAGGAEPFRQGRKVGRTLYLQRGDEASDNDLLVGLMDTRELATRVVATDAEARILRAEVRNWRDGYILVQRQSHIREQSITRLESTLASIKAVSGLRLARAEAAEHLLVSEREKADEVFHRLVEHFPTLKCDHANKRDRIICDCARVDLGWWPSILEAKFAWRAHVRAALDAISEGAEA